MVAGKNKRVRKTTGPALVILSGKERQDDDHDAILDAIMAGQHNPYGLTLVFRGEGVLDAFPALELCDRLKELIKVKGLQVAIARIWHAGGACECEWQAPGMSRVMLA